MPLLLDQKIGKFTRVAVWKVKEDASFFLQALNLTAEETKRYSEMRTHRQREWLSSRYLLHFISTDNSRRAIIKTTKGQPQREHCSKKISISHSKEYTAVTISQVKVGIDIQVKNEKISKIAHKFISKSEALRIDENYLQDYYHIFWGAKEAMYKAYGLRQLEFREHMHLYPFTFSHDKMELKGWVRKNKVEQHYDLYVQRLEETYLVLASLTKEV